MSLQAGLAALKTGSCIPLAPSAAPSPTLSAASTATAAPVFSAPSLHNGLLAPAGRAPILYNPALAFAEDADEVLEHAPAVSASAACPICSSPLKVLAGEVPYSHHVNSTVVCSISGRVVEGDGGEGGNLVAMVGHGHGAEARVYSKEGLAMLEREHAEGKQEQLRRVYIL